MDKYRFSLKVAMSLGCVSSPLATKTKRAGDFWSKRIAEIAKLGSSFFWHGFRPTQSARTHGRCPEAEVNLCGQD